MTPPSRIVLLKPDYLQSIVPLWLSNPFIQRKARHFLEMKCDFPPNWNQLIGVRIHDYSGDRETATILNTAHPILKAVSLV